MYSCVCLVRNINVLCSCLYLIFYFIVCLIYNLGKLNLQNAEDYKYLRQSNCYSISGVNDADEFRTVMVHYLCSLKMICFHRLLYDFLLLLDWLIDFEMIVWYKNEYTIANFQEALDVVHIRKEDQENVFAMLAAVLWLGNISFTVIDNENHVQAVEDEGK